MESMANNVLSEQDLAWVELKKDTILLFASGNYAGDIPMDDRENYHRIAQQVIGFNFIANWTCGSCVQKIGVYIKTSLQWH